MNEADTRAQLIDPMLKACGWGVIDGSKILREHNITAGKIEVGGGRAKKLTADYVLVYKGIKLAVIEAKSDDLGVGEGVAQAKQYAEKLKLETTYSTNGSEIYSICMKTGAEGLVATYLTPDQLWDKTYPPGSGQELALYTPVNQWRLKFADVPFEDKSGSWQLRYYQEIAVRNTIEAIASGKDRILLTLATGTGKTAIAFQIAWKLFQTRWNLKRDGSRRPRILFLADRNILADQAYNAFSAFAEDALVRIDPEIIRKKGRVPKNGNIFFTIFQTFMTGRDASGQSAPSFGDYPPDFFDVIIIDECHRGGANDEGTWRKILEYFAPAVQLGLTATPKRQANADTYAYFGEPVYTYSLKEGINDGFLTPFKVRQIATTLDDYVYTSDDDLIEGEVEQGKRYVEADFNRLIEIEARERYRVKLFMDAIDQGQKTLVFCANQPHALAVRDYINQMKVSKEPNYCVRVTAFDGKEGERFLRIFQDNEKTIPTILTTSQKLSTGVDARNIRNIVLMRPINSMIEFKQIIGRGTRLFDGKDYFTIYDFVRAYEHFTDPEWDGEPEDPVQPTPRPPAEPPEGEPPEPPEPGDNPPRPLRIKIKLADGKERSIQSMIATSFWSVDGRPMSAAEFVTRLFGELPALFKDEDELRALWSVPQTRKALLETLAEKGFGGEQLQEIERLIDAEKSDLYDVLAYIAFALSPITRQQRADTHREDIAAGYDPKIQTFLDFVLAQYIKEGVGELDDTKLPQLLNLKYRSVGDAAAELGGVAAIREAFIGFQRHLYT